MALQKKITEKIRLIVLWSKWHMHSVLNSTRTLIHMLFKAYTCLELNTFVVSLSPICQR